MFQRNFFVNEEKISKVSTIGEFWDLDNYSSMTIVRRLNEIEKYHGCVVEILPSVGIAYPKDGSAKRFPLINSI